MHVVYLYIMIKHTNEGGYFFMKDNIIETEDNVLNYLYDNKASSPQSISKIKLAINLGNGKGNIRVLKASLESLMKKKLITKQAVRGNYKIEQNGIEHIEKDALDNTKENTSENIEFPIFKRIKKGAFSSFFIK